MRYRDKPDLKERLASEYVLGTLAGRARRRFEAWMREDADLRRTVAEWSARLNPLTAALPDVAPHARVWSAVAARIAPKGTGEAPAAARASIWDSLAFWRGLGLAASGLAAALLVFVGVRPPQIVERVQVVEREVEKPMRVSDGANPWQPSYVATLKDKDGKTMLMIYVGSKSDELWVKYEGDDMPKDSSLELWGLDANGQPKSLGLIKATGKNMIKLPDMAEKSVSTYKALAVSMEPMGGSKMGTPTGPVMYKGDCHTFW
ncbi:MAG: anti-sigma factor [Burkholderiales bacterium]|nr:anti-sigma factor [Burkholderiales bacterium]